LTRTPQQTSIWQNYENATSKINLECRVLAVIIYLPGQPSKHIREIEFTSESSSPSPYSYTAELYQIWPKSRIHQWRTSRTIPPRLPPSSPNP
jgi:hypothetical protein